MYYDCCRFEDGDQHDGGYNDITESMYYQIDSEGPQFIIYMVRGKKREQLKEMTRG